MQLDAILVLDGADGDFEEFGDDDGCLCRTLAFCIRGSARRSITLLDGRPKMKSMSPSSRHNCISSGLEMLRPALFASYCIDLFEVKQTQLSHTEAGFSFSWLSVG
ncbi:MAG: hypothetical protein Q9M27_04105 [Mariprofundaceae bacterium]|nr:hypothetical protein [Mariprofundaceae bacterium]